MCYINYYSHQDSHLFCASIWIHFKKISFKPPAKQKLGQFLQHYA